MWWNTAKSGQVKKKKGEISAFDAIGCICENFLLSPVNKAPENEDSFFTYNNLFLRIQKHCNSIFSTIGGLNNSFFSSIVQSSTSPRMIIRLLILKTPSENLY